MPPQAHFLTQICQQNHAIPHSLIPGLHTQNSHIGAAETGLMGAGGPSAFFLFFFFFPPLLSVFFLSPFLGGATTHALRPAATASAMAASVRGLMMEVCWFQGSNWCSEDVVGDGGGIEAGAVPGLCRRGVDRGEGGREVLGRLAVKVVGVEDLRGP